MDKKKVVVVGDVSSSRLTTTQLAQRSIDSRATAVKKALEAEKVPFPKTSR